MTEKESELTDAALRLEGMGVTRADLDKHRAELAKKFGVDPSVRDILWLTLNVVVSKSRGDPTKARFAYQEMASMEHWEGHDCRHFLARALEIELREDYKGTSIKEVTIRTTEDDEVCPKCRALSGRRLSIEEALATLPLPNECEEKTGWCRCSYVAVIDREFN
jgi:hypothetical protein